jgi:hypothetical protein
MCPKGIFPPRIPKDAPFSFTEILLFGEGKKKKTNIFSTFLTNIVWKMLRYLGVVSRKKFGLSKQIENKRLVYYCWVVQT